MAELGKAPEPLQIIGGRYRVESCLASGVESNVLGAIDCATGKRVALKCWDGPTSEQEVAALQCFVRSANVTGLFENPHVVEVYATELGDSFSYCVTERLEGSSLARELERVGRLPVRDALRHVLPCMRAVLEAHAVGVIHGDIRPAHIFLCRAKRHLPERARVFDFGRGSPGFHELRLPTRVVVDELCRYTPPELLSGGALDARSDIYAFGLLLYEVITGERIFVAEDLFDLLRAIEAGPRRAIADVTQALPRGLVEVLYRAMAVKPDERYQELAMFLDALLPFAGRSGGVVQPGRNVLRSNLTTDRPAAAPYVPSHASRVWPSAALLGVLLAGGYLALHDEVSEPRPEERVTARHPAVHAQPEAPQPELRRPSLGEVPEVAHVPDDHTHVSTARDVAPRKARVRARVQPQTAEPEAQPTPPDENEVVSDGEPAASDNATPLERMQLQ